MNSKFAEQLETTNIYYILLTEYQLTDERFRAPSRAVQSWHMAAPRAVNACTLHHLFHGVTEMSIGSNADRFQDLVTFSFSKIAFANVKKLAGRSAASWVVTWLFDTFALSFGHSLRPWLAVCH